MIFNIKSEINFIYKELMKYSSFFGSFVFWLFAVLLLFILNQNNFALKFILATIIVKIAEYSVKLILRTKRPSTNEKTKSLLERFHDFGSMPSGHASVISLFTAMIHLSYSNIYLTSLFVVVSLLSGLSRIYLKRHYLADVVVGYVIGIVVGMLLV